MKIRASNLESGLLDKSLGQLTDIEIATPSNGQVLKYNSTSGKWENAADATGGGGSGVGLGDFSVNTDPASGGGSLSYSTGVFTFAPASVPADLSDLTDTTNLLFSGNYNDLSNTPTLFSGSYNDLTDTPTLFSGSYNDLTDVPTNGSFVNVTSTGILTTNEVIEGFQTYNTTITGSPVIAFNATLGHVVNVTGTISSNFTANWTNTTLSAGKATNFTLVLNQGATAYIVSALQIGGSAQTINWQGNAVPSGNANKKDVFAFTVMCTAANTYTVFGQLVSFG